MQPSTTVPFFYRATGSPDFEFEENDVTITTLITADRFPVFKRLVDTYTGPISVTIHTLPSALPALLPLLHAMYTSAPAFPERVDVHLVIDAFPRQFNTWRNAARLWARTKWVMMLDVDFALCTDFRAAIRGGPEHGGRGGLLGGEGRRILDAGGGLVVPAFEYTRASEGANASTFPTDKPTLLNLVRTHRIGPFHASWAAGHAATLYPSFYAAPPGAMYPVPVDSYQAAYEPYVVFNRFWGKGVGVRCDERFAGYGGNKAACVYEHWLAGGGLWVLADHWVVHQSHVYKEGARRVERKSNRRLSSDFREDACVRWLHRHLLSSTLHTPRGRGVFGECARVRGVARIGAQVSLSHSIFHGFGVVVVS
ncbi:glycosyltransferase family 49 protein [Athelia psychrophila]|uniref:Glycosyltransferase family 49 protein n=1 Tax=Athelia psychrophila TaxID=1759441 RepID=A0A166L5B1_9AGAM|nr:glycosyltransferase family 49 protein [Fibularhizoctonia sp. CBS 109695]